MVLHHNRTAHAPWGRVTGSGARATRSSGTLGRESRGLGRGPRAHEAHQKLRAQSGPIRRLVHKRQRSCNSNVRCTRKHNGFGTGITWQRHGGVVTMAWPWHGGYHPHQVCARSHWLCTIIALLIHKHNGCAPSTANCFKIACATSSSKFYTRALCA